MRDPALWAKIEAFPLDAPTGSAPFSKKLQAAEGWTEAHTGRVIAEYRRFLYLTQVSPDEVTPSEDVDRVWHMHLTYTRNYWDDLCGRVLGRALHHDPCGGPEEMGRYRAQYLSTLRLYRHEFGAPPPAEVWPTAVQVRGRWLGVALIWAGAAAFLGGAVSLSRLGFASALPVLAGGALATYAGFYLTGQIPRKKASSSSGCGGAGCGGGCGGCGG